VTPGFAKPRSELPWLPYGETDRVIINAHNFTRLFSAAVNGKMPIAAWIPSRDTAGNGTTTLTALVGASNGTLKNMDAATDWVADANAGGVRALDFDGVNDFVDLGVTSCLSSTGNWTVAGWILHNDTPADTDPLFSQYTATAGNGRLFFGVDSANKLRLFLGSQGAYASVSVTSSSTLATSTWFHIAATRSANVFTIWLNGASVGTHSAAGARQIQQTGCLLGRYTSNSTVYNAINEAGDSLNGRIDDVRVFDQTLDATDMAYLYSSGSGRGISA